MIDAIKNVRRPCRPPNPERSSAVPVVVVTDSSACLSPELVDRFGIRVVPLHLLSGGRDLLDGVDRFRTTCPG